METFNTMVDLKKREAVGTAQFTLGDSTSGWTCWLSERQNKINISIREKLLKSLVQAGDDENKIVQLWSPKSDYFKSLCKLPLLFSTKLCHLLKQLPPSLYPRHSWGSRPKLFKANRNMSLMNKLPCFQYASLLEVLCWAAFHNLGPSKYVKIWIHKPKAYGWHWLGESFPKSISLP